MSIEPLNQNNDALVTFRCVLTEQNVCVRDSDVQYKLTEALRNIHLTHSNYFHKLTIPHEEVIRGNFDVICSDKFMELLIEYLLTKSSMVAHHVGTINSIIRMVNIKYDYSKKYPQKWQKWVRCVSIERKLIKYSACIESIYVPDDCQTWLLDIYNVTNANGKTLRNLRKITNVNCKLEALCNISDNIETLGTSILNEFLLKRFNGLRELILHTVRPSDIVDTTKLSFVPSCVTSLDLSGCMRVDNDILGDNSIIVSSNLKNLKTLRLNDSFDSSIEGLKGMSMLQHLTFGRDFNQHIDVMVHLSELRSVSFGAKFEKPLRPLVKTVSLKSIRLTKLAKESLYLGNCDIDDDNHTTLDLETFEVTTPTKISYYDIAIIKQVWTNLKNLLIEPHEKTRFHEKYDNYTCGHRQTVSDVICGMAKLERLILPPDVEAAPIINKLQNLEYITIWTRNLFSIGENNDVPHMIARLRECIEYHPCLKRVNIRCTAKQKEFRELLKYVPCDAAATDADSATRCKICWD